jgi:hypothetical protein
MKRSEMRYSVKQSKGGKNDRFYVWDKEASRIYKGKLSKFDALGLEGVLNKLPHKDTAAI